MDCSLPGSSVYGISQAKILERVAISFSRGISLTQGLNPHLLHCRWILYHWATRKALSAVYIKSFWFFPWHSVSFPDLVMFTACVALIRKVRLGSQHVQKSKFFRTTTTLGTYSSDTKMVILWITDTALKNYEHKPSTTHGVCAGYIRWPSAQTASNQKASIRYPELLSSAWAVSLMKSPFSILCLTSKLIVAMNLHCL